MIIVFATEHKSFTIQHNSKINSFKLFDQNGFLVSSNISDKKFDYSHLSKGTYTVCITDAEGRFFTEKFNV